MAPRATTRPEKDSDYSNIGISGRRTGVSLAPGRLDANGLEELSGIFSSPRKPSPLRKSTAVAEDTEALGEHEQITPQTRSTRNSKPLRSASPRKSGISGTARRSKGVDVLGQNRGKENQIIESEQSTKPQVLTPTSRTTTRRFSPVKSPVPAQTTVRRVSKETNSRREQENDDESQDQTELAVQDGVLASREKSVEPLDFELPLMEDDTEVSKKSEVRDEIRYNQQSPIIRGDEQIRGSLKSAEKPESQSKVTTIANSRRKRKSDAADSEIEQDIISSPAAKRAKRISFEASRSEALREPSNLDVSSLSAAVETNANQPNNAHYSERVGNKINKSEISARQQRELDAVVDKIKARPGQKKSLYILRREDRNDSSTQTRSGRISVKPLAYWRNERCVYGGSPGAAVLQEGARFPLNSIKEIIRTEEVDPKQKRKSRKTATSKSRHARDAPPHEPAESDSEQEQSIQEDLEAEPWEIESGTRQGFVSLWDPEEQQAMPGEEEEVDIAYAAGAIEAQDFKGSGFKYAILLSTKFFASGLVELPSGSFKKPKNSTKMQMSFFVVQGRVTATVGPVNSPGTRFSIGKGGFWQVPRGNQYSIENEHAETAKMFFSQGCESEPYHSGY